MDPPAFHIEASTPDGESYAVNLHTAFPEVVLPTVATHRPVDGFVASLGPYTYVYTCPCIHVPKCTYRWRMHGYYNVTFSTSISEMEKKSSNFQVYWSISRPKTLISQHNVRTCILRYQQVDLAKASALRPQSHIFVHYSWRYRPPKIIVAQFRWSPQIYSRGEKNSWGLKVSWAIITP